MSLAERISAASGDASALLSLAIELAQENARLSAESATLHALEEERKAKQASRTRRHRQSVSRDVTLQTVTERDVTFEVPPSPLPSSSFPTPHITPSFPPSPSTAPTTRTIRVVPAPSPDVEAVVSHHRGLHPRQRPGEKDRKAVVRALKTYSVAELCEASTGNAGDSWCVTSANLSLAYVCRDNATIDKYREKAATFIPPVTDVRLLYDYERMELSPLGERMSRP